MSLSVAPSSLAAEIIVAGIDRITAAARWGSKERKKGFFPSLKIGDSYGDHGEDGDDRRGRWTVFTASGGTVVCILLVPGSGMYQTALTFLSFTESLLKANQATITPVKGDY